MNFETSKTLGGIGALLVFIGLIPPLLSYTIGILPIVGIILLLIGLKGLADYYKEAGIFNNALYGSIAGVVGPIISFAIIFIAAIGIIDVVIPGWNGDWATMGQFNSADISTNFDFGSIAPFIASMLVALLVLFVAVLVAAILYRKSFGLIRDKSSVGLFGTAGTILLIGAALTIILVGLILVWIAVLLVAIAFFQLKEQTPTIPPPQYPPQYSSPQV